MGIKFKYNKNNIFYCVGLSVVLWCILAAFVFLAYYLSSQDGASTYRLSYQITVKIAKIIYGEPTGQQITFLNQFIRKMAHFFVYFVMTVFAYPAVWSTVRLIRCRNTRLVINIFIFSAISVFAFYDEWHKQYIPGRHNSVAEAFLNVVGCLAGLAAINVFIKIRNKR